jgi:hypothetical protein
VGVNQLRRGNDIFQTKNIMLIFIEFLNWFQAYNIPEKKFSDWLRAVQFFKITEPRK